MSERAAFGFVCLLMVVPAIIWRGFALSTVWGWFAPPIFGLPALGVAQAIGVTLVIHGLFGRRRSGAEEAKVDWGLFSYALFDPAATIGIAWVVKQFAF